MLMEQLDDGGFFVWLRVIMCCLSACYQGWEFFSDLRNSLIKKKKKNFMEIIVVTVCGPKENKLW